jgi:hypothetical protein
MAQRREFRFKIDGSNPEQTPMKRLAEYVSELAKLFGDEEHVHLIAIEASSTCPVILVDWESEPLVLDRIEKAKRGEGPSEPIRAIENVNMMLSQDSRSASLLNPSRNNVLEFPGLATNVIMEWPTINQYSELYGVPIAVGGKNDPVPVHLLDGEIEQCCLAERAKAKEIAAHLFTAVLRVSGRGRWRRMPSGDWSMERFVIDGFETVKTTSMVEAVEELRSVPAKWKLMDDPLGELAAIRNGQKVKRNGGI